MNFKTIFYINIEDEHGRNGVQLKKERDLKITPYEGMKIRMKFKKQEMKSVIYDVDKNEFTVELKIDDSLSFGFSKKSVKNLINEYLKEGWERTVPLDPKERMKNLEITSVVSEIEYAIKDLKVVASIRKISNVIVKHDLIRGVETEEIFNALNLDDPIRILILNDINRILSEKDITTNTDEEISCMSFNELLEAIKEIEDHTSGKTFIDKMVQLIFDSGIKQEKNIHQIFYFAKISPERGNEIMSRVKDLKENRK